MKAQSLKLAESQEIDQQIYDKIYRAIIEQRILPGTKLGEKILATSFGVNRSRIRRVLLLLSNRNVVELRPNKGAFVATPKPQETRHVFEARRTIERTIVSRVVERITEQDVCRLKKITKEEGENLKSGNRHNAIRLSGEFHLILAEIAGNHVLHKFLEELVSRTSLIIGMYGTSPILDNSKDEHSEIVEAIVSRDLNRAIELMDDHLHNIEELIHLPEQNKAKVDFIELFANL